MVEMFATEREYKRDVRRTRKEGFAQEQSDGDSRINLKYPKGWFKDDGLFYLKSFA